MNVLGTTSSSQSRFVTRYSYGMWFNATDIEGGFNNLTDKLTQSNWEDDHGVSTLNLLFYSIKINGTLYSGGGATIFSATSYLSYNYRNDGYGVGFASYIDQLNIILQTYQLRTRFYPAPDNQIIGIINTAENFEVNLIEFADGFEDFPDIERDYLIRCVYGSVFDSVVGGNELGWS